MFAEVGTFALILALIFSILLIVLPAIYEDQLLYNNIKAYVLGLFAFVSVAYLCLTFCFIANDFKVYYVAAHSSLELPWFYKICAVWGGHEGSMLLWVAILSFWMLLVAFFCTSLSIALYRRIFVVSGFLSAGFLLFLLMTSNPFGWQEELLPSRDLNPFLQDLGFLFHPPMLYMGYVGFAISFAFAIAALWLGKVDLAWVKWVRVWTLSSWTFLTAGITLGSWWAYRELGWGGWWFWDPVENASFMPWIIGTALLHSLIVNQQRQLFQAWAILLAIIAFSLSLIGTFLVRSGILTSVHAFAVDPGRGFFILIFLTIVIGGSLLLFAFRAQKFQTQIAIGLLSRENLLILNNILLVIIMATVLLGTLYPLIIDLLGLGKLSVGAPYFNTVLIPEFLPLLILMGLGMHCQWQGDNLWRLSKKLWLPLLLSISLAWLLLKIFAIVIFPLAFLGLAVSLWIILTTLKFYFVNFRLRLLPMVVAHLGIAVMLIGITISTNYELQKDISLAPGQQIYLADYNISWLAELPLKGPNYHGVRAVFSIQKQGSAKKIIYPEKRIYDVAKMAMTDAAIDANLWRDIYIALAEPLKNNEWALRIYYKPFIRWIWGGGALIFIGGFLAIFHRACQCRR